MRTLKFIFRSALRRRLGAAAGVMLVAGTLTALPTGPAAADPTPPDASTPATVTADALPTVQIDGVVWSQAVAGTTVFAGGSFANARPAGSAAGQNLIPRTNLLSYDVTTGNLNTSFAPVLNGQVKVVRVSPDGSTLYVGGDFTTVNGQARSRAAAFDVASGSLLPWAPAPNDEVDAIVPTSSAVYLGGNFTSVTGVTEDHLAAVVPASATGTGGLLSWTASTDGLVQSMATSPDGTKLIVGGKFATLNGSLSHGIGAVSTATGAKLAWALQTMTNNDGSGAGFYEITSDSDTVYATGWAYGRVVPFIEGMVALNPADGTIKALADCHGDTYSAYPIGNVVYTASHHHNCANIGGFGEVSGSDITRGNAYTKAATGVVLTNKVNGWTNWAGQPASSLLQWYPNFNYGTYTGQSQGPWTVTGTPDGKYVVMGGEFTTVNFVGQQGLVRFATLGIAPGKVGPKNPGSQIDPTMSTVGNSVRLTWTADDDRDSEQLSYKVIKTVDPNPAVSIGVVTAKSYFWSRPVLSFTDPNATPGQTVKYQIAAIDPQGNRVNSDVVSYTVPVVTPTFTGPITGLSGKCITDQGGLTTNGNPVVLSTCTGDPSQVWSTMSDSTIRAFGKCLSVTGNSIAQNARIVLSDCDTLAAGQIWTYDPSAQTFTNPNSKKVLEVYKGNPADGTPLDVYSYKAGSGGQKWQSVSQTFSGTITGLAGKCVTDAGDLNANGNPIVLSTCTGAAGQTWIGSSDGTLRTVGKCLYVPKNGITAGTKLVLQDCNNTAAGQLWTYDPAAQKLTNPNSGLVLDVAGGNPADGTALDIAVATGAANQQWSFRAA